MMRTISRMPQSTPPACRTVRTWSLRGILALALAVVFGLVPAAAASAHDYPVDWSPEPDSTVTEQLDQVSITFDDVILDLGHDGRNSLLQVTGPDPKTMHFETDCAAVNGRTLTAPVELGAPGEYTITYQIVSADGHTVSGQSTFAYQPRQGTEEAEGTASSVCAQGADTQATASADSTDVSSGDSQATALIIVVIVGGIILLAVIAVGAVLLATRRRGSTVASDSDEADRSS